MCRVFRETTPKEEENARGPRVYSPPNLAQANDDALTKRDLFDRKYLQSSYQGFTTEKQSSISRREFLRTIQTFYEVASPFRWKNWRRSCTLFAFKKHVITKPVKSNRRNEMAGEK